MVSVDAGRSNDGFAFPKELRNALVESAPEKFSLPSASDMPYHWVHVRLSAIDADEMREFVEDAWAFCVQKRVAEEYALAQGYLESGTLGAEGGWLSWESACLTSRRSLVRSRRS